MRSDVWDIVTAGGHPAQQFWLSISNPPTLPSFSHSDVNLSRKQLLRSDLLQVFKNTPVTLLPGTRSVYSIMPSNKYSVFKNVLLNYCCLYVTTTAWIVIFRCDYILYIWWGIDIYCNALVHTTKKGFVIWPCVCIKSGIINYCMTHTLRSETSDMLCMDLWQTVLMKQWNWILAEWLCQGIGSGQLSGMMTGTFWWKWVASFPGDAFDSSN